VRKDLRPPHRKLFTITNGVELTRYGRPIDRGEVRRRVGIPVDARLVIVVAKLMEQKGQIYLIRGLPSLLERVPDLHVVFVGEGPMRSLLTAAIATVGAGERAHLVGNRGDVSDLLAASDLFVLPSLWEGLPMALLEAMASSLPAVATRVSGSAEVIVDGKTGVLVPPANPPALVAAIGDLLDHPEHARQMGLAARDRVERLYSGRMQAARHAELFRAGWGGRQAQ
jgi:glycosyltransferase involved in cell wall biosynthesis